MRTTNTRYGIHRVKNTILFILPGSFVAGLLTYFVLSYFYIPANISVTLSIIISILIFGLNTYYLLPRSNIEDIRNIQRQNHDTSQSTIYTWLNFIFIWISGIVVLILILSSTTGHSDYVSFIPWQQMTSYDIIKIAAAIAFSFFLPGYAILGMMDKNYRLSHSLRFLLSYLISILFIALPSYIVASLGYFNPNFGLVMIALFVAVFVLFILQQFKTLNKDFRYFLSVVYRKSLSNWNAIRTRIPQLVVFASLLGLVLFYTYYLNDGVIVSDQWFHHGRALLIGSQLYRDVAPSEYYKDPYTDSGSDITQIYPPIFSALLAGFFDLTNSASVNAYVSIGFLNVMPVFAFYYFFTRWVPANKRRAALFATTLFVLSSGFGWMYAVDLAIASPPSGEKEPEISSINILALVTDIAYDIGLPTTFINVGHPDITTPLIIIAIPAGFTLLGMIKEVIVKKEDSERQRLVKNKERSFPTSVSKGRLSLAILKELTGTTIRTSLIVTLISFLGILSHDEFYLIIIIACVAIVILLARPSIRRSLHQPKGFSRNTIVSRYSIFFSSFLTAMLLVTLVDTFISPAKYYVTREIFGVTLISLSFIFVLCSWAIYVVMHIAGSKNFSFTCYKKNPDNRITRNNTHVISSNSSNSSSNRSSNNTGIKNPHDNRLRLAFSISTVSVIAFFYLFTFMVWSELPNEDIQSQIDTENQWNVPWYLYPMKFGLTGLLGLAFLLSYLFRKFEKEIFVFVIIVVIALLAGPYYDEHRFGKYIMAGMASFAALLIYGIISKSFIHQTLIPFKVVSGGILVGLVITFSGLSIFMFAGFVELFTNVSAFNEGTRRDFPTHSEMQLLDFLHNKLITGNSEEYYNIALPEKEVDNSRGFLTKIYGFTPIPRAKLLQTPLVLNASTIETFYNLLDYSGTKFIVLPKNNLSSEDISPRSSIYTANSIVHFAENFQKVYEDDKFVVLEVPALSPPSHKGDVALIYPKRELLPYLLTPDNVLNNHSKNNTSTMVSILPYNASSFKGIDNLEFVKVENESNTAVLNGYKEGRVVLWSDLLELQNHDVNYVEAIFRIIDENKTSNDAGIVWDVGNKEYTVSVRNDRLETLVESTDVASSEDVDASKEPVDKSLVNVREMKRENGIWYTLKIIIADDIANIYVDGLLVAQLPMDNSYSGSKFFQQLDGSVTNADANASSKATVLTSNNSAISRVGLFSFNNIAEFKPIRLGQVSFQLNEKEKTNYQHYYPLSMLALSNIGYTTYIEGDLSAFSKKYVILPYDPPLISSYNYEGEKVVLNSIYLDYVRNGGNLIVMDSGNYGKYDLEEMGLQGVFGRLLSISPTGNSVRFDGLSDVANVQVIDSLSNKKNLDLEKPDQTVQGKKRNYGNIINITGTVEGIMLDPFDTNEDIIVKSYYVNSNYNYNNNNNSKSEDLITPVALFVVEKKYGDGKIIYVNSAAYFQSIFSGSSTNDSTYPHSNKGYFSTLVNITELIEPNLVKGSVSETSTPNAAGSLRTAIIRQIVDNIQIFPGYTTIINSSSLLVPASDNNNVDFVAEDVTFRSSSSENSNYSYGFRNSKVDNLKIYGTYQVIVESKAGGKILLPTLPSFSDYVAMSLPNGFDMTVKLSDSNPSYAEFEVIGENYDGDSKVNGTFRKLRVYGDEAMDINTLRGPQLTSIKGNEIHFHNIHSDLTSEGLTSLLMKSPQFHIIEGEGNEKGAPENFLAFKRNSPEAETIEIKNEGHSKESVNFRINYVDSYSQPYREGIKSHHLTYIEEDVRLAENHTGNSFAENSLSKVGQDSAWKLDIKLPGEISESAKKNGFEVHWQNTITSDGALLLAILIIVTAIIAAKIAPKLSGLSKLKLP